MNTVDPNYREVAICLVIAIIVGSGFRMLKHRRPALFLGDPNLIVGEKKELAESNEHFNKIGRRKLPNFLDAFLIDISSPVRIMVVC